MKRLILKDEATIERIDDGSVVSQYFNEHFAANLGVSTAIINRSYPPEGKAKWAVNETVEEMYYVLKGTATIVYEDGITVELVPESAVYMPKGIKYRVENAQDLSVVIATGPVWTKAQHQWSDD